MPFFKSISFPVLLLAALLCGVSARAQNYYMEDERTFYGGVILGTNFTQVDGDNFAGYHKIGLNVGGIVYIKLDEHVAASMEILFSQKGSRATDPQVLNPGLYITKYNIDLNYAEVPLMINYFDKRKSHFGGGVSYSQLASYKESITTQPYQNIDLNKYPFKKGDLNLVLGGSLRIWKGFFFNLRFQYSLISIRDKIPQDYAKAAQYNNMWTIRMMYLFM